MKEHKKNNSRLLPKTPILSVLLLVVVCIEFAFVLLLLNLDILPGVFIAIVLAVILAVSILIWILLSSNKEKTRKRKLGVVLSVIVIVCFAFGGYYLFSTQDTFNKISSEIKLTEDFHVVALENGSFDALSDIEGKTVYVTSLETDNYSKAKGKLLDKVNVSFDGKDNDYLTVGYKLLDDKGIQYDNVIFISNTNYEILCEEINGFEEKTKIIHTISVVINNNKNSKEIDVTKDSFNVYISGIDTFGKINKVARSDVNMIVTVNPSTKEILLTSIPRDMYLPLHSYGAMDKLTHSGIYGIDETTSTVEDWLGIDINYYVRVNFTTLVDIVDVIGGIEVDSEYAFESRVSEYSYVEGTNYLNGREALFFARERKNLEGGDNERIKNQQRVLKGIIEKITGSPVLLTKYTELLNAVEDEMQTNLSEKDISALIKMQLEDLGGWTIKTNSITGTGSSASTYSMGSRQLYVAIPNEGSVKVAQDDIYEVLNSVEE